MIQDKGGFFEFLKKHVDGPCEVLTKLPVMQHHQEHIIGALECPTWRPWRNPKIAVILKVFEHDETHRIPMGLVYVPTFPIKIIPKRG